MTFPPFSICRSLRTLCCVLALVSGALADEIVYDNTANSLEYQIAEKREFGDELVLGGTARTLTEVAFEYFGDFVQQGDEAAKVRLYSNEKPYDLYRNEPTTVLYESGFFPINPGYNAKVLPGFNAQLRDVVTFTIEVRGLAANESVGLLLYNPPTVGRSYNEFWRRNANGKWEAVIYNISEPGIKAKAAVRLTAVETLRLGALTVSPGHDVQFGINGLRGLNYRIEASADLKEWRILDTQSVIAPSAVFKRSMNDTEPRLFYRVRLP